MRGKHTIRIENKNIRFDIEIKRNITVIRGDSATGKTTLIDMIAQYERDGERSGIELVCDKNCVVLTGIRWQDNLKNISDSIVFIDENDRFIVSMDFAVEVRNSDNYYVLVTRDNLQNLPYSVDEIYGIHSSGRYSGLKKTYNELYRIYSGYEAVIDNQYDKIVCEDSNAGYEFFFALARGALLDCVSANGKSKIKDLIFRSHDDNILVIADGAAFGCEMNSLMELKSAGCQYTLYLPESFEWIILCSGLIDGNRIKNILQSPWDYIDSEKYFSWERYFYDLLRDETEDSYLRYSKSSLNDVYIHQKEREILVRAMGKIGEIFNNGKEQIC